MSDMTITHTHADGTLLDGDPRPHHGILKAHGWRWSRNLGAWYVPQSRDRAAKRHKITPAVAELEAAGFTVTIDVDDAHRPAAERIADQRQRSADRADRLDGRADRRHAESAARYATARTVADGIPLGQPVMPDHYSYRSDVNRRAKMHRNFERSFELADEARAAERSARIARRSAEGKTVGETRRKIDELEAEVRRIDRELGARKAAHDAVCGEFGYREVWDVEVCVQCGMEIRDDMTDERKAQLERNRANLTDELGHWRGHLADLEAAGRKVWGPDDFKAGDVVNRGQVSHARIVRVNKKSLTVEHRYNDGRAIFYEGHTGRLGYDKVRNLEAA